MRRTVVRRPLIAGVCAALLAGCASHPPAPVVELSDPARQAPAPAPPPAGENPARYRVVRGDTLYAIAFRHGVDFRDIAAWNHIEPPYRIYAGQELLLHGANPGAAAASARRQRKPALAEASPKAEIKPPPAASTAPVFEDVPPATAAATPPPRVTDPGAPPPGQTPAPAAAAQGRLAPKPPGEAAAPAAAKAANAAPGVPDAGGSAADSVAMGANGIAWRWPGKGALVGTFVAGDPTRQGIDIAGQAGDPVLAAADGEVVYSGNGLLGYGELIIVKHSPAFLSAYGHNRKRLVQEGQKIKRGQQIAEMGSSASSRDELHFEIRKNGKPVNPLDYLPAR